MNKCLKIMLNLEEKTNNIVQDIVLKYARKYELEGVAQAIDSSNYKIVVCGHKDNVDAFLDILHKESSKESESPDIQIEPHVKDRDYRGIFRVIE